MEGRRILPQAQEDQEDHPTKIHERPPLRNRHLPDGPDFPNLPNGPDSAIGLDGLDGQEEENLRAPPPSLDCLMTIQILRRKKDNDDNDISCPLC